MQKQQVLHCNVKIAGAKMECKSSSCYTVMQKYQAVHCNANVAGATL
jgi:hypothetical protein